MKKRIGAGLLLMCLAGCGDNFEWFPGSGDTTTPNQFVFVSPSEPVPFDTYSSNAVTISGISADASINISGDGQYSINGGTPTAAAGTIKNGQTVKIFHDVTEARKYRSKLSVSSVFAVYSTTGAE